MIYPICEDTLIEIAKAVQRLTGEYGTPIAVKDFVTKIRSYAAVYNTEVVINKDRAVHASFSVRYTEFVNGSFVEGTFIDNTSAHFNAVAGSSLVFFDPNTNEVLGTLTVPKQDRYEIRDPARVYSAAGETIVDEIES